jgi:UDPglucose--hexose-1-phosphate uridylyltransferase
VPEVRVDELAGTTTIVVPGRSERPDTFTTDRQPLPTRVAGCPFCPGNEHATPPELERRGAGAPDTPGWRIRVVPNLYPIVEAEAMPLHEVTVLSPAHDATLAQLPLDHVIELFGLWRDRAARHADAGAVHVAPFVNHGRAAGGSIEHPHSQMVAVHGVEPPDVIASLARFAGAGRDLVAGQLTDALQRDLVVVDDEASAWCPYASSSPYESVIAHPDAGASFERTPDHVLAAVARTVRELLRQQLAAIGDVAYNLAVHTTLVGSDTPFHWHVRVTPRVAVRAGFELVTGLLVNVVTPEDAAEHLRTAT